MIKSLLLLLGISLCFSSIAFAETIHLKSGKTVEGKIIEKTSDYVKILFYELELTYFWDEIEHISQEGTEKLQRSTAVFTSSGVEKQPNQIFNETASGIVVITAQLPQGMSQGSGFVVDKSGIIMTNFHVVGGAEEIEVKLKDGSRYPVTDIVDYNIDKDVCLLKINAYELTVLSLGDANKMIPGEKILVIGAPLGLEYSVTDGLFSGKREIGKKKSLQFSAPISPGNSGGPLLNMRGEVVGITTFINPGGQNLNFAIPINEAKEFIHTYSKINIKDFSAKVSKAYLLYNNSWEAFFAGNAPLAVDLLRQAISVDANFIDAYIALGEVYNLTGNIEEEMLMWKKVLDMDPNYVEALINLGICYYRKGMVNEAISFLKKAISIDPNDGMAHNNLAAVYEKKNMLDEALIEAKEAVRVEPNYATGHEGLGFIYYRKGMLDEAISETRKAIALDPGNGQFHINLLSMYLDKQDYDSAITHCDSAIRLGQVAPLEFLEKLKPYRKENQVSYPYVVAPYFIEDVANLDDNLKILLGEAYNKEANNDYKEAYRLSNEAFNKCLGINNRGYFYVFMETLRRCSLLVSSLIKERNYPEALNYSLEHIRLIEQAGGLEKAINNFNKYLNPTPLILSEMAENTFSFGYFCAGIFYACNADIKQARSCLDKIKGIAPNNASLLEEFIKSGNRTPPF